MKGKRKDVLSIRITNELKQRITSIAEEESRSITKEVIFILEKYLKERSK